MMQWKKDPSLKYTDLCIYIDKNIEKLRNPGEYPEVENTIYNYLWLVVKALAIKKSMFQNFQDYDPYAFHAANRLFFALRKNLQNQGKTVKGKVIRPIKSCLNYTKALLVPMRIEYQREAYREILDEEFTSKKFDAALFKEQMSDYIANDQSNTRMLHTYLTESLKGCTTLLDEVLDKTPFHKDSSEYRRMRISVLLNCIQNLKTKGRMVPDNNGTIILWRLPKSMAGYIKILIKEFCNELSKDIKDSYNEAALDQATIDKILTYKEGSDYDYEDSY